MNEHSCKKTSLEHLLEKICTIARERASFGEEVFVDLEFEGFSHHYNDGIVDIAWRSVDAECSQSLGLDPNGIFVSHRGEPVLSRSEDRTTADFYKPGEWEIHIDALYEGCAYVQILEDPEQPF